MSRVDALAKPSVWTAGELEKDRKAAINRFVVSFFESGSSMYETNFNNLQSVVESLFEKTTDLTTLESEIQNLQKNELSALRFTAAPPLSEANLATFKNALIEGLGVEKTDAYMEIFTSLLDPKRFSWLHDGRLPSTIERSEAIRWTTSLWSIQKTQTANRTEPSHRQETAVKDLLESCGYEKHEGMLRIDLLDDLPRGCFRSETVVSGEKCDVPVRLRDGRLLLLECKVSNSTTNSTKRLIRETCGKAASWTQSFGAAVLPAAVLDGVFSLTNLREAQNERGIYLFWEMRLEDIAKFLRQCEKKG